MEEKILDDVTLKFWEDFSQKLRNPKTKAYYLFDIVEYVNYIQKNFYDSREEDANRYYEKLRKDILERRMSGGTALRKCRVLSRFSSECLKMEEYPKDAIMKKNLFLPYVTFLKYYDQFDHAKMVKISDIDRILSACRNDLIFFASISIVCRMGLSSPEVCRIKCNDIYRESGGDWYICIMRKGKKYIVSIPSDVKNILQKYEEEYRIKILDEEESYFLYKNKFPLSERVLEKKIQKIAIEAGVPGHTLRAIRNTSANLMYAYGAEEQEVSDQLGVQVKCARRYRGGLTDHEISLHASDLVNLKIMPPI